MKRYVIFYFDNNCIFHHPVLAMMISMCFPPSSLAVKTKIVPDKDQFPSQLVPISTKMARSLSLFALYSNKFFKVVLPILKREVDQLYHNLLKEE